MRTWERANHPILCGRCGHVISFGLPVQRVGFAQQKRRLIRCESCAEGKAPPDLPSLPINYERGSFTKPMAPLAKIASTYRSPHPND